MNVRQQSSWQTVKSRTEEKKKGKEEVKQSDVKKDRLGVAVNGAFADFDKAFSERAAAEAAGSNVKHGSYAGAFSGLEDERPAAVHAEPGSPGSSTGEAPAGVSGANGTASPAKAKVPKIKKPRITVASVAEGVDVAGLQTFIAELQQRYAASETSQLEMLSDYLLKMFKDVQLEFNKGLADKPLDRMTDVPLSELPQPLQNALASFVGQCGGAALRQVLVTLLMAVFEGLPDGTRLKAAVQPPKPKVGLLIVLASILRTRPEVLLLALPDMLAAGRTLSAVGRLPQLLWVLNQAAAAEPSYALAAWVRLLLPQLLGAELPATSKPAKAPAADGSTTGSTAGTVGAATPQMLESACVAPAIGYLQSLLQLSAQHRADVGLGNGESEAVVPGAAVELLSRVAFEGPSSSTAAAVQLRAMHGPLLALAGSSAVAAQYAEWLPLALETAALSQGPPDAASSDPLVVRGTQSIIACLIGSDATFSQWESKHKAHLKGSARVLQCMDRRPELVRPLTGQRPKAAALRTLAAALPARHRSQLAQGKGWQGACARVAEDACAGLARQRGAFGGRRGSGGSGAGLAMLSTLAVTAGVVGVAAWHRAEVTPLVAKWAGAEAAHKLDAALLVPLQQHLMTAHAAAAPLLAQAQQAVLPYAAAASKVAEPHVVRAQALVEPLWQQAQEAAAPLVAKGSELLQHLQQQLEEIWQRAKQQ